MPIKFRSEDVVAFVNALGVNDVVQLGISLTERGVDAGSKAYVKSAKERSALVEVAEVYSSEYRLKLEDAKRWLEEDGLKVEAVIARPDEAFKDCTDFEVVASNYKLKQKVKPGTRIILRYVTSEVIEASRELFNEAERKKAEKTARNKQNLDKSVANVQKGLSSVVANTQKGIDGIISNLPKREKKDTSVDTADDE